MGITKEDIELSQKLFPSTGIRSKIEKIPFAGKLISKFFKLPNPYFHPKKAPERIAYDTIIKDTLKKNPKAKILNIGSQSKRKPNFIYLDIVNSGNVDIIADAAYMSIRDNTVDLIINIAVLEHVKEPSKVASECFRILKPGGKIFVSAPFHHMFHTDPTDIQRYTHIGLANLFKSLRCEECNIELGPANAMTLMVREFLAILFSFNSKMLYDFFQIIFGYITYPIKFLDYFLVKSKFAFIIAASVYFVGVKNSHKKY